MVYKDHSMSRFRVDTPPPRSRFVAGVCATADSQLGLADQQGCVHRDLRMVHPGCPGGLKSRMESRFSHFWGSNLTPGRALGQICRCPFRSRVVFKIRCVCFCSVGVHLLAGLLEKVSNFGSCAEIRCYNYTHDQMQGFYNCT